MSFGRKGVGGQDALAERRAAFVAAERARQSGPRQDRPAHAAPAFVREKSTGTAYLLWFFFGGLSVHRFYLGFPVSGAIQAAFLPISWALIFSGSLAAFLTMTAGGLWILADAFLIPGLAREANARLRRVALDPVFS
ncbi:MAG TPA: TM2 domain-containing protein [Allosphingosinicella sp.]|nr:TM2 domain-containing protein [Allosphingosinicella sp.]